MTKIFNELTGYNTNQFVKVDHVFIKGEGTFFETKELASKNNHKTGNEVGLHIVTYTHEGVEIYREAQTNVWD
jgi:hypothetical protein